jgi:hypothetical protein
MCLNLANNIPFLFFGKENAQKKHPSHTKCTLTSSHVHSMWTSPHVKGKCAPNTPFWKKVEDSKVVSCGLGPNGIFKMAIDGL